MLVFSPCTVSCGWGCRWASSGGCTYLLGWSSLELEPSETGLSRGTEHISFPSNETDSMLCTTQTSSKLAWKLTEPSYAQLLIHGLAATVKIPMHVLPMYTDLHASVFSITTLRYIRHSTEKCVTDYHSTWGWHNPKNPVAKTRFSNMISILPEILTWKKTENLYSIGPLYHFSSHWKFHVNLQLHLSSLSVLHGALKHWTSASITFILVHVCLHVSVNAPATAVWKLCLCQTWSWY